MRKRRVTWEREDSLDEADQVSDEQLWARLADAEPGERAEITLELAERAADQEDH